SPGGLDRRREGQVPADVIEPDRTDERCLAGYLDDELAEAVFCEMGPHPRDPDFVRCRKIAHDFGVGGHRGKRRRVLVAPLAQNEVRRAQCDRHGYFFPPPGRPVIWLMNISCNCSNPFSPAGSQFFNIVSGSSAFRLARIRSSTSLSSSSCIGLTSGRPKKLRNSSGVQSMSNLIFMLRLPSADILDKPGREWHRWR